MADDKSDLDVMLSPLTVFLSSRNVKSLEMLASDAFEEFVEKLR